MLHPVAFAAFAAFDVFDVFDTFDAIYSNAEAGPGYVGGCLF